jgi:hypothetical protein
LTANGYMANRIIKSATEALVVLWEERFFKAWKNISSIVSQLADKGNNFSPAELGMALKRAKHLTRRGNRGSYEYIQKYPYFKENTIKTEKTKNG